MKTTLLILASLFLSQNTFGQIDFRDHLIIGPENSIRNGQVVINGDLDDDGDQDLVVSGDGLIGWFENIDGQGTFESLKIITSESWASEMELIDLDGDGDLDFLFIVPPYYPNPKVAWLENVDGLGNFGPVQLISEEPFQSVYSADLDGDGDMDVILGGENMVAWYENLDGSGNFGNQIILANTVNSSVSAADVDGDNDMDILVGTYSDFYWLENNGQGSFDPPRTIINTKTSEIYPSDLDGDGDVDLVCINRNTGGASQIVWFENNDGLGTFGPKQIVSEITYGQSPHLTNSIDLDGDGDLDIVGFHKSSSGLDKVVWYENIDGLGNFGTEQTIVTAPATIHVTSVCVSDLDGDGDADVSFTSWGNFAVAWSENSDGLGNFDEPNIISASVFHLSEVYAIDIDGDGDIDVLSVSRGDEKLAWYENVDGQGIFRPHTITYNLSEAKTIKAGDIDGDGDIDVVGGGGYGEIGWYENLDGLGHFSESRSVSSIGRNLASIFLADLDNDGDLDIVGCAYNEIFWHENLNGLGNFSLPKIIASQVYEALSVFVVDIDQDGDMDVLSASSDTNLAWYENIDGLGNFGLQKVIPSNFSIRSVFAADIDNDGDMDVLSALSNNTIVWFENIDGLGTFSPPKNISTNSIQSYSVYAADLDGDGDLDVVCASYEDHKIIYYENIDGLGTFGPKQIIAGFKQHPTSIFAADINGDNKMDVLSATKYLSILDWYENAGPLGTNENQFIPSTTLYPNPSDGFLYISSERTIIRVSVYNQLGQIMFEESNNKGVELININNLAKGLYFVKLMDTASKSDVKKIILK